MSPRTVISWAQNYRVFKDLDYAFEPAFFNRCDEAERPIVAEYDQPGHGKNPEFAQQGPVMRGDTYHLHGSQGKAAEKVDERV
jgi:hypothetical protein